VVLCGRDDALMGEMGAGDWAWGVVTKFPVPPIALDHWVVTGDSVTIPQPPFPPAPDFQKLYFKASWTRLGPLVTVSRIRPKIVLVMVAVGKPNDAVLVRF